MSTILAIDPGNTESGWVIIDSDTRRPLDFAKTNNHTLRAQLMGTTIHAPRIFANRTVIEMVASYGMAVGADVFETCVWIGRFIEATRDLRDEDNVAELIKRNPVKVHHCHSSKAKDSNIRQALVDRFAPGASNYGKGTKAEPGWFYGFSADVWQAYALAVYKADQLDPAGGAPF